MKFNYTTYFSSTDVAQSLTLKWGVKELFNPVKQTIEFYTDKVERSGGKVLNFTDIIDIGRQLLQTEFRKVSYKDTYPYDEIGEFMKNMSLYTRKNETYYKTWADEIWKIRPWQNHTEIVIGVCISIMSKVSKDNYWTIR